MKWLYLFLAGALEITWAVAMKKSNGFTVIIPSIITPVYFRENYTIFWMSSQILLAKTELFIV